MFQLVDIFSRKMCRSVGAAGRGRKGAGIRGGKCCPGRPQPPGPAPSLPTPRRSVQEACGHGSPELVPSPPASGCVCRGRQGRETGWGTGGEWGLRPLSRCPAGHCRVVHPPRVGRGSSPGPVLTTPTLGFNAPSRAAIASHPRILLRPRLPSAAQGTANSPF